MKNRSELTPAPDKYLKLAALRDATYEAIDKNVEERMKKNPMPTDQEILLGSYLEDLEPAVQNAILEFNKKGYRTQSSGFGGLGGYWELQQMDGPFDVDKETTKKLKAIGVSVRRNEEYGLTHIEFEPELADVDAIKRKWDQIAEILPDLGKPNLVPGGPWINERWEGNKDIQKRCIERRLALGAYDTAEQKFEMERWLAESG